MSPKRCALHLLVGLLVLPASACDSVSVWLAGVDRANYTWVPLAGTTVPPGGETAEPAPEQTEAALLRDLAVLQKDVEACLAPGGKAAGTAGMSGGGVRIVRSEGSDVVTQCMEAKGYRKAYLPRSTLF